MTEYTTYLNGSYEEATRKNMTPLYPDFWRNDPLSEYTLIDPRRAGFKPYPTYTVVATHEKWIDSDCAVFQHSCDIILPVNKCYVKNREIISPP